MPGSGKGRLTVFQSETARLRIEVIVLFLVCSNRRKKGSLNDPPGAAASDLRVHSSDSLLAEVRHPRKLMRVLNLIFDIAVFHRGVQAT
jgi:hypothetical protein